MATTWDTLSLAFLDLPPPQTEAAVEYPAISLSFLDLPPGYGPAERVTEDIEWTLSGSASVTWYYGNTAYDTVLEKWVEWHTWYDPDPEGIQYPGSHVNWQVDSYSYYVISIEGL